jgi:hypothetical protein
MHHIREVLLHCVVLGKGIPYLCSMMGQYSPFVVHRDLSM